APRLVGRLRLALVAAEVERLGAGLVAEALALQVRRHREDLQAVPTGQLGAFLRIGRRPLVVVAAAQVELPAGLLPAVEAGLGDEREPVLLGDAAELAAHQADLMIRRLAEAMLAGLFEAHDVVLSLWRRGGSDETDYTAAAAVRKRGPEKRR